MDGIALARQLKHNPRLFEIPVILLSSRNSSEAKIEGWTVGADEFITGPIIPSELLARVDSLILSRKALRDRYAKRSLGQPEVIEIPSTEITFLNRVKELVTLHLENPSFSVGMLASELNISEAQLKRRMNALVGEPPVEYIRNFRLDRAAQLLDRKAGSVSEISFAVGFQNLSYFSKCFRERFGTTPSQFGARVDIQAINSETD
jgi:AraC-like DNA-binding protein